MTATVTTPTRLTPAVPAADALAIRYEVLHALDTSVRILLRDRLVNGAARLSQFQPAMIDLTIYDRVYRAMPAAGGHWTVTLRRPGFFTHAIATYTVTLEFDNDQRPARFQVTGAKDVVSDDATLEALDRALVRAAAAGPQITTAPSFVPGFSL